MLDVRPIQSLDLPELEPYRTLRRSVEHERQGIFVAEGEKIVRRLLETNLTVISVLVTADWLEQLRPALERRAEIIHAYVGEKTLLHVMVGFDLYQGVLAIAKIPQPPSLAELLRTNSRPHLLVALDGLANATNLGVVARNCAAFGVQALLLGETCSGAWLRRSVRNSMGAMFHLPTLPTTNLAEELRHLQMRCITTIAAHPHPHARLLSKAEFTCDCCLVFGSEGHGISPAVLAACTEHIAVTMPAHVDSLNVSSAAAVFLYEVNRQRGKM